MLLNSDWKMNIVVRGNNRTHEIRKNRTMIVLMLQAGLAAPINKGIKTLWINSNLTDDQLIHWFWCLKKPTGWFSSSDHGMIHFPSDQRHNRQEMTGKWTPAFFKKNKSQSPSEWSNLKPAKPWYTQNINSSRFFPKKTKQKQKKIKKNYGKFHMLPPKCSITRHRRRQFSDPLVPSIRHLTGSKVRTATASTFTLKRASLRLRSAADRLRLCQGEVRGQKRRASLTSMQNLRNERV